MVVSADARHLHRHAGAGRPQRDLAARQVEPARHQLVLRQQGAAARPILLRADSGSIASCMVPPHGGPETVRFVGGNAVGDDLGAGMDDAVFADPGDQVVLDAAAGSRADDFPRPR